MNHQTRALRAEHQRIRADLNDMLNRAAAAARDLTTEEVEHVRAQTARADVIAGEIAAIEEDAQRAAGVTALRARVDGAIDAHERGETAPDSEFAPGYSGAVPLSPEGGGVTTGRRGATLPGLFDPPPLAVGRAQLDAMWNAVANRSAAWFDLNTPAARVRAGLGDETRIRSTIGTAQTGVPANELVGEILTGPRRIADFLLAENAAGWAAPVKFPVFGSTDTAGIAAEGETKPEYDQITAGAATPQTIAIWTDVYRQALLTMVSLNDRLTSKHLARVAKREDKLLIDTVAGTSGIQTYTGATAEPYADSILAASAKVLTSDVATEADLAIVHPLDLRLILGGAFAAGASGERPVRNMDLNIFGLKLYPSLDQAQGTATVGSWRAASRFVVGQAPIVLMDSVSGLKTNVITILTEESVALAVYEPAGFCLTTFGPAE